MKMPLLALYERSLRLEMRNWVICFVRLLLLGWLLLQLLTIMAQSAFGRFGAPGLQFFEHIAWLNFVFITIGGLSYFASAIAEEKEEMTLGLLRMTGLDPLGILLGKSTARLTGAMLLVLVQVPFTMLAVTLGGVSVLQIVTAYCVLLSYLFLLSNLALIWSVVFQRTGTAGGMTALCLLGFLAAPHIGLSMLKDPGVVTWLGGIDHGIGWLLNATCLMLVKASAIVSLSEAFRTGATPVPLNFQVISNLVAGVVFFGIAWLVFERCTREQKDASPARSIGMRLHALRGRVPPNIIGARALTWKESGLLMGGPLGMTLRILLLGAVYAGVICFPLLFDSEQIKLDYVGGSMMVTSLVLAAIILAFDAAHIFLDEMQWKTLASLMILPISVRELVYRKVLGRLVGVVPLIGFFLLGALIYPSGLGEVIKALFSHVEAVLGLLFGLAQFILFLHLVAFFSLVVKRWALVLAFVAQYVGGSMCLVPFSLVFTFSSFGGRGSADAAWIGLFLGIGVTVGLIVLLQNGIGSRLRRVAAEE